MTICNGLIVRIPIFSTNAWMPKNILYTILKFTKEITVTDKSDDCLNHVSCMNFIPATNNRQLSKYTPNGLGLIKSMLNPWIPAHSRASSTDSKNDNEHTRINTGLTAYEKKGIGNSTETSATVTKTISALIK